MLYEYLTEHYKPKEPIFVSDIKIPSMTDNHIRQSFKVLNDNGKIRRYDTGIYYLPGSDEETVSAETVARYKYISRNGSVDGYYTGDTFAWQIGLLEEVPFTLEIASNRSGGKYRELELGGQKLILRKPRREVTEENFQTLQFLDLMKDVDLYTEHKDSVVKERLRAYAKGIALTIEKINKYLNLYPDKIYRNMYETELYEVLTEGKDDEQMGTGLERTGYRRLDLGHLNFSDTQMNSETALRDIVPVEWSEDVRNGNKKAIITKTMKR